MLRIYIVTIIQYHRHHQHHTYQATGDNDDDEMYSFLSDSDDTNNHWEDYFTGFPDKPFKSHLDSIGEEFEHRNRTTNLPHKPPKLQQPESEKRSKHAGFPEMFGADEGLLTGRLVKHDFNDHLDENSYETYQVKWKRFLDSDENIVLNYRDVLWPPFCARDQTNSLESSHIENILKFVQYSTQSLRQLQIDWHPDKFSGRFGTRFKSEAVKNKVMKRVVNISQLINKATDYLRKKEEAK
ncbi:NF kappa B inhibitor 1 [Schistosoma japonicum]|uniref:NF kappa B inhibitor 1 n=1 Tax=Schistosoma japonicum TaxID=6182 RepID=A0A4Z2DNB1_SCHJA|nr:NF kappa B inhibitor 1 [Schistosoma japonicum]TNN17938.1 NF kappa B inhibitor 1 [Schistosoma japonicum]TNN17939.1 NF kappa B inhibitor 1 [Schistosoma japonicum]TNN17940.1 NF kappa B inhibitor 1 [Schistosoma japonicum]